MDGEDYLGIPLPMFLKIIALKNQVNSQNRVTNQVTNQVISQNRVNKSSKNQATSKNQVTTKKHIKNTDF